MNKLLLYFLTLLPLLASCQQKYSAEAYDQHEAKLRAESLPEKLTRMIVNENWEKRDSLSYLRFKNLEDLYIQTDSMPSWINRFTKLKRLATMSDVSIMSFPENITELTDLEYLYLENGRIKSIPNSINQLKNLKELGLDNNNITKYPKK